MIRLFFLSVLLITATNLLAQETETVTVKAGTSLNDYFSASEGYIYPGFKAGRAYFNTGVYSERKFNYNFLSGEIVFVQNTDTLEIINKHDISMISIEMDTFYYDKGYILQVRNDFPKVGMKDSYKLLEVQKKDPYGVTSSGSSTTTYNNLPSDGNYYELKATNDMVFKRTQDYYIATEDNEFVIFNKKNVFQLFPDKKDRIKSFIKANKLKFDQEEDLFKLAEFIQTL